MTDFELHPRLAADTIEVTRLPLCRVLLMNDANFPWIILVPERSDIREIHELRETDQLQLIRESSHVSRAMNEVFTPDKMNIAALSNVVPQLHIHHIARFKDDPAWPRPAWGARPPSPYAQSALEQRLRDLAEALRAIAP